VDLLEALRRPEGKTLEFKRDFSPRPKDFFTPSSPLPTRRVVSSSSELRIAVGMSEV